MDFSLSEEQQAVAELAGQILGDLCTHERLREWEAAVRASPEGAASAVPEREWQALADAGLLGLAVPEAHGGAGLGLLEACLVAEQVGRTVAPVPYLATVVLGALPVARFGTPELRTRVLPVVVEGRAVLSAALTETGRGIATRRPATVAQPDTSGSWRLSGQQRFVPWGAQAQAILVPATSPEGVVVALVDAASEGVVRHGVRTVSGEPQAVVELDGVAVGAVAVLGGPGGQHRGEDVLAWMVDHATAGVCTTMAGVTGRAVELIGTYTSERHQFGVPIATFQAVAHRAADAYIDAAAVRDTAWRAAWCLATGRAAADALDVAKFWAAEGGQRVVHAAQHLHGGVGVDRDYPLHRYFLWAKVLELTLGGATERLAALGARMAVER